MHTLVWPLPHRPVQLDWTCQECETPTDTALGVIEARKPSHHFKVHAPGDGVGGHLPRSMVHGGYVFAACMHPSSTGTSGHLFHVMECRPA